MRSRKEMDDLAKKLGYGGIKSYLDSDKYLEKMVSACKKHPVCQLCRGDASMNAYLVDVTTQAMSSSGWNHMVAVCPNCDHRITYDSNGDERHLHEKFAVLKKMLGRNPGYGEYKAGKAPKKQSKKLLEKQTKEMVKYIASEMFRGCKYPKDKHLNSKQRNIALAQQGYASYKAYLGSPVWNSKRTRILQKANHTCSLCGGRAKHCHHRWYTADNLLGTSTNGIVPICLTCHKAIEFDDKGEKVWNTKAVEQRYRRRMEFFKALEKPHLDVNAPACSNTDQALPTSNAVERILQQRRLAN